MTQNYIDIAKVWTINASVILANKGISLIEIWGNVIESVLTICLLTASIIYTVYKTINEKDKRDATKDSDNENS